MKSITARQVRRKFSGIDELCRILSVRHGIEIATEKSEDPDNPRNNALIVSFEFADDKDKHFLTARDILIDFAVLPNPTCQESLYYFFRVFCYFSDEMSVFSSFLHLSTSVSFVLVEKCKVTT